MRKEWKKSLLVFKMSQRSLFECGVSKSKADESDLADNAESVPTSASSDQPQQPTKNQKPSSSTPGKTHSRFQDVWLTSLTGLNTTPNQNACSAKSVVPRKARTFSQMKAQVCIFLWC